jgi:hypothetical protein
MIISFRRADLLTTNKELAEQQAAEKAAQDKENLRDLPLDDIESNPNIAIVIKSVLNQHADSFCSLADFFNEDEINEDNFELEWQSRSGFWSHVNGAFGLIGHTTANDMLSSGKYPGSLHKKLSEISAECTKDAIAEVKVAFPGELKDVPDDKIDYHNLYQMNLPRVAEHLSELESDYQTRWDFSFIVKVYYYNPTSTHKKFDIKKPEIYVFSDIEGSDGKGYQKSFTFSTLTELHTKLDTAVGAAIKALNK